ncbi:MAG TPA: 50S ribosomal protein L11 methyltransferase [Myxococcota bacterium]|nr:50S ribosomal protein L11 methyltransferase [Myxococcota bacterium]
MSKASTRVQFTPYEISMCLYDVHRTRLWKQAIEDLVRPGDVVVDAGAGTGILSVFAALDGAARVHAVELHPRFVALIEHMAARNGLSDRVHVHHADASQLELPEPADLLICELLCTGQFFEPEVQVINHLRQFLAPGGRILPRKVESFLQLLDAQEELYGVRIDTDSRSDLLAGDEPVSTRTLYDVIDLTQPVEPARVDTSVVVRARKTRVADAVVITSRAWLTEDLVTERTRFLYNPEVIFLKEPVHLVEDETYRVDIAYDYGCDTLDVELAVTPA